MHFPHAMHEKRRVTLLFPLVVFFLLMMVYCTSGCLAAATSFRMRRCIFDEIMRRRGRLPTAVVREVPRKGQGAMQAYTVATTGNANDGLNSIRIVVSHNNMENGLRHCNVTGVHRSDLSKGMVFCREEHVLTPEKKNIYENFLLPHAIKLHTDRILVKPMSGALVVPKKLPYPCNMFLIPPEHEENGVDNADMLLYAAAAPMEGAATAFGLVCAVLEDDGRPSVGVVNYNPAQMVRKELAVRILAHEIAHALGFGIKDMEEKSLVSYKSNVRGKSKVMIMNGTKVQAKAREHFNCDSLEGMELEDDFVNGAGSHWERRNARDELMAPRVGAGRYTALTLATFADLGYYAVRWDMAEPMSWGRDAGCTFLEKKCTQITNLDTALPHMFCSANTVDEKQALRCSSDRHHVGKCTGQISDRNGDKCPVVSSFFTQSTGKNGDVVLSRCSDESVLHLPGSLTGKDSWCLDAESLEAKKHNSTEYTTVFGVCAQVACDGEEVMVKYLGSNTFESCPEGGEIEVKPSSDFWKGGKIKCPKYADVCTIAADGSGFFLNAEGLGRARAGSSYVSFRDGVLPWARNAFAYIKGRDGSVTAASGFASVLLLAVATAAMATLLL